MESRIDMSGSLSAMVHRANGKQEDLGVISGPRALPNPLEIQKPMSFWEKLWWHLRKRGEIPLKMSLSAFMVYMLQKHLGHDSLGLFLPVGLVTTAGAQYLATDFQAGQASPHIGAFIYHDCGTGAGVTGTVAVTGANTSSPIQLTVGGGHGKTTNDLVIVASVGGQTGANGTWQCTVQSSTLLTLLGSSSVAAYTSGGTVQLLNGAADTGLVAGGAGTGGARVAGAQSNPSALVYKTVATIPFSASQAVSEWGLFSAASSGTLWDRRWFNTAGAPATTASAALTGAPINVNNGDSISFSYQLSISAGGS